MRDASRRPMLFALGALTAILVAAYLRPLVAGDTFALRDHITLTVPARAHLAESLRAGAVPEWWDGVGMGVPFAANPMHGAAYPPAWIVAALPVGFGADLIAILHVLLLGAGAAVLARRLGADPLGAVVAGGVMMCCGYTSSMVPNGVPLLGLAWTPWVAWAADRVARRPGLATGAALAAFLGAQIMAGDPAAAVTAALLAGLWVVARADRRGLALAAVAGAVAGALVLAAVTVVPALELLAESRRAGGLSTEAAGVWSMHPARIVEWVWPGAFGDPTEPARNLARVYASSAVDVHMDPAWSVSLYLGAPVMLFAFAGALRPDARLRGLLIGSAAFVVLALGTYTPLYAAYRFVVVPERVLRYPERHIAGALVVWSALAGVGFTRVFREVPGPRLWKGVAIAAGAFAALVALAGALQGRVETDVGATVDVAGAFDAILSGGITGAVVLGLVAVALALRRSERYAVVAPALAAAAVIGHLVGHGWSTQPLVDRDDVAGLPAVLEPLAGDIGRPPPRLYRHRSLVPARPHASRAELVVALYETAVANTATRFGVAYVPGYDPAAGARLEAVWEAGARRGARLLDLYDVQYRIARRPDGAGLALVGQAVHRPRAFVATRWTWLPDDAAVREALVADDFDRARVRLAGRGDPSPAGAPAGLEPCAIEHYEATAVTMRCRTEAPGFAVLLDAWAPGWTATVNGEPAVIERADALARAVRVDAGESYVEHHYRTPGLRLGAVVSLLGWLNLAALLFVLRWRGR